MRKKIVGFRKYSEGGHREIDKNKDKGKGIILTIDLFYDYYFEGYYTKGNNLIKQYC